MYIEAYETSNKWFQTMRLFLEMVTAVCFFYYYSLSCTALLVCERRLPFSSKLEVLLWFYRLLLSLLLDMDSFRCSFPSEEHRLFLLGLSWGKEIFHISGDLRQGNSLLCTIKAWILRTSFLSYPECLCCVEDALDRRFLFPVSVHDLSYLLFASLVSLRLLLSFSCHYFWQPRAGLWYGMVWYGILYLNPEDALTPTILSWFLWRACLYKYNI